MCGWASFHLYTAHNGLLTGDLLMRPVIPALLTTLILTTATTATFAQDEPSETSAQKDKNTIYDVNFPGGTMAEYTDLLLKTFPNASIILMPGTEAFVLPKIHARIPQRGGGMDAEKTALELVCGIPGMLFYPRTQRTVEGMLEFTVFGLGDAYRVEAVPIERPRSRTSNPNANSGFGSNKMAVTVYPLIEITDGSVSMEEILGTLKVAFDLEDDTDMPTIRYHEPTSILFVRGTHKQLDTVDSTLEALKFVAGARSSAFWQQDLLQEKDQKILALESTVEDLSLHRQAIKNEKNEEIRELREEIEALNAQLQGLRKEIESSRENAQNE